MGPVTTTVGTWLVGKIADKGFESISNKLSPEKLNKLISRALSVTSKKIQTKYPDVLAGNINYFFQKEELLEEIIKLTFRDSKINIDIIESNFDLATLPDGFIGEYIAELKAEMLKNRELNELLSNSELFIALTGLKKDIEDLVNSSTLSRDSLIKIKNILEEKYEEDFAYNDFLKTYSSNAINNLSEVNFIGLGVKSHIKKNRKRLQEIFVKPKFVANSEEAHKYISKNLELNKSQKRFSNRHQYPMFLNYDKLFSNGRNFVMLGNPGAGKSLLCKSVICSILERKASDFADSEVFKCLPFRIELRKYSQHKKQNKTGLLKYIITLLETEYGMPNVPEKRLKEIFSNKKTIIFFDGLDEIFDISEKIEVKNDIENFAITFSDSRNVVTSRIIGYEEVKLKQGLFIDLKIIPFDEEQITQYVTQWYDNEEPDEVLKKQDVEGFLSHIHEIDAELITNPLLLSLIVILYRNNLKIPESKLEIYQSCTKTLVDKWDGIKDLTISLDDVLAKRKESIFADLAYWHYIQSGSANNNNNNNNITNARVQETIADTIIAKLRITDDFIEGNRMAEQFLDYAQKRSLYFDNNFTHKTFLEYFTAFWIYSNVEKKHKVDERDDLISQYISSNFWYVVLELLLNLIDDSQADNEILDALLLKQLDKADSYPFVLIVIPTIKNVSPKIVDKIYLNALRFELDGAILGENKSSSQGMFRRNSIFEYFSGMSRRSDIYKSFIKAFDSLYSEVKNDTEKIRLYFIMYDELMLDRFDSDGVPYDCVADTLKQSEVYRELLKKDSYLYLLDMYCNHYVLNKSEFDDLLNSIRLFGLRPFFKSYQSVFSRFHLSYWDYFVSIYLKEGNIDELGAILLQIEKAGISRLQLFRQLKNRKFIRLGFHAEQTPKLLTQLSSENEQQTNMFIVALIYQIAYYGDVYQRGGDGKSHMIDLVKEHEFDWLQSLLQTSDKKVAFDMIEEKFKRK